MLLNCNIPKCITCKYNDTLINRIWPGLVFAKDLKNSVILSRFYFLHLLAMNIKCSTLSRIWQRIQCTMFKEKNTKLTRHLGIELFICEEKSLKDNLRVQKNFYMIVYMIFIRSFRIKSKMISNYLNRLIIMKSLFIWTFILCMFINDMQLNQTFYLAKQLPL